MEVQGRAARVDTWEGPERVRGLRQGWWWELEVQVVEVVCVEGRVCACLERMCVQHVREKRRLTRGREEAGHMCCELMCESV
jgi:hypothetical protein